MSVWMFLSGIWLAFLENHSKRRSDLAWISFFLPRDERFFWSRFLLRLTGNKAFPCCCVALTCASGARKVFIWHLSLKDDGPAPDSTLHRVRLGSPWEQGSICHWRSRGMERVATRHLGAKNKAPACLSGTVPIARKWISGAQSDLWSSHQVHMFCRVPARKLPSCSRWGGRRLLQVGWSGLRDWIDSNSFLLKPVPTDYDMNMIFKKHFLPRSSHAKDVYVKSFWLDEGCFSVTITQVVRNKIQIIMSGNGRIALHEDVKALKLAWFQACTTLLWLWTHEHNYNQIEPRSDKD